jgi:hypothetical protein
VNSPAKTAQLLSNLSSYLHHKKERKSFSPSRIKMRTEAARKGFPAKKSEYFIAGGLNKLAKTAKLPVQQLYSCSSEISSKNH